MKAGTLSYCVDLQVGLWLGLLEKNFFRLRQSMWNHWWKR